MKLVSFAFICWLLSLSIVNAFQDDLLKNCDQSGFCHRNRMYAERIQKTRNFYYSIDIDSLKFNYNTDAVRGIIHKTVKANQKEVQIPLYFTLRLLDDDKIRFQLNEARDTVTIDKSGLNPVRYSKADEWAFDPEYNPWFWQGTVKPPGFWNKNQYTVQAKKFTLQINVKRFSIKVLYDSREIVTINDQQMLNFEHYISLEQNFESLNEEEEPFNMFQDSFKDSRADSIPFGPESVALDFKFHGIKNLYGIPEHADSMRLRDTSNSDPYRLYNVDVFQYNLNSTMPMYGAVPFLIGVKEKISVGIFWINPSDTWVDIRYNKNAASSHWMSESGVIDFIIIVQDTPKHVTESYVNITGKPLLPLMSSIGYHQCRWNYNDEKDVLTVDSLMDKWQVPYDFIWLDLEYADEKKYFTWKPDAFPNPTRLLTKLDKLKRNLVTLIDPHIKSNYKISNAILSAGVAVQNALNKPFHGQCWPGESIWIDTFNPAARELWSKFVHTFVNAASNLHIWNDMNEPSIFDGPETTAPKDLLHYDGYEERSVHNLYGLTVHQATYDSFIEMNPNKRPFILTRSFFSGSQRTAASWTGDNVANWDYLELSIPMVLSHNIVGMPNTGADIAGFFGDPDDELLIRWYQAGIWYPFFRAHAHIDTKRREPYLLNEPTRSIVRETIKLRYQLLPTFYTAFHDSHERGIPIMNPMLYEHPDMKIFYNIDDQFYLGEQGILVKPVTKPNVDQVSVSFPSGRFYDLYTLKIVHDGKARTQTVSAPLEKVPAFIKGGHIISRKDRYRRSSSLMKNDPYTLVIAPSSKSTAKGRLYIDDGETFEYKSGQYLEVEFELKNGILTNTVIHEPTLNPESFVDIPIEKVIMTGLRTTTITDLNLKICEDWELRL